MNKNEMIKAMVRYYTEGNKAAFARLLGIPPQTLASWGTREIIDAELLYKKCKDISAEWLLSGEGEMIKGDAGVEIQKVKVGDKNSGDIFNGHDIQMPDGYSQVKKTQNEINALRRENYLLKEQISDLKDNVKDLRTSKDNLMKVLENLTNK